MASDLTSAGALAPGLRIVLSSASSFLLVSFVDGLGTLSALIDASDCGAVSTSEILFGDGNGCELSDEVDDGGDRGGGTAVGSGDCDDDSDGEGGNVTVSGSGGGDGNCANVEPTEGPDTIWS